MNEVAAPDGAVIQEVAERLRMDAVQPGHLLLRAGRSDNFGGTHRTLAATLGDIRGKRAEHTPLTAAHRAQALPQVIAIEQRRIGQAPPHLVQQIPVLPGGPQLADKVTDGMQARSWPRR
jgi:hypothetical protein